MVDWLLLDAFKLEIVGYFGDRVLVRQPMMLDGVGSLYVYGPVCGVGHLVFLEDRCKVNWCEFLYSDPLCVEGVLGAIELFVLGGGR